MVVLCAGCGCDGEEVVVLLFVLGGVVVEFLTACLEEKLELFGLLTILWVLPVDVKSIKALV